MIQVALSAVLLFFIYLAFFRKGKLHHIPGPKPWPLLGNTLQVNPYKPYITFLEWSKVYGPVFSVNIAGEEAIVVQGTEELHELLIAKGDVFADRSTSFRLDLWSMGRKDLICRDYDDKFKWMKKSMMKALKVHKLGFVEDKTREIFTELVKELSEKGHQAFDPSDLVFSLQFQIVYAVLFASKIEKESQEFKTIRQFDEDTNFNMSFSGPDALLDLFPWLRFFGHRAYKGLLATRRIAKELNATWKERFRSGEMQGGWYEELLKIMEENKEIDEEEVMMIVMDAFLAGTGTTSSSLLTLMNIMAQNPHFQEKLQKEVHSVEGDEPISFSSRDQLPYTFACVLESVRYATPTAQVVPRKTRRNTSLGGFDIPKGTVVHVNFWGQNHDPDLFQDPYVFRPERFLDSDGKMIPAGTDARKHATSFGAGPRVCAGEAFAMARLFTILTLLCQNFTILPATRQEEQVSIHPLHYTPGAVAWPQPFKIRMIPRKEIH